MSIPKRNADANEIVAGERTFFVTSSTSQKRPILQTDRAAQLLVRILYELRVERRYLLHAFVVMPDHFHVIVTVGSEFLSKERCNSSKVGSHSVPATNCSFEDPYGNADFRKREFKTKRRWIARGNIFMRIR